MKIDVKELSKINLEKGDVLVIKMNQQTGSPGKNHSVGKMLEEVFPNNKVILARHDDKFEVIKQKALTK